MRIPRKLKIGGRTVTVRFAKLEHFGEADYANNEIVLKKGMNREAQEATFVHEIMHHMNTSMSHALLDSLAEQVYQVFKHNNMFNDKVPTVRKQTTRKKKQ